MAGDIYDEELKYYLRFAVSIEKGFDLKLLLEFIVI